MTRPLLTPPPFGFSTNRPELADAVAQLAAQPTVQREMVGMLGEKSPGFLRYERVLALADDDELVQLLLHPAPVVRAYMTWAIAKRCPDRLDRLEYLLGDEDAFVRRWRADDPHDQRAVLALAGGGGEEAAALLWRLAFSASPCQMAARIALVLRPATSAEARDRILDETPTLHAELSDAAFDDPSCKPRALCGPHRRAADRLVNLRAITDEELSAHLGRGQELDALFTRGIHALRAWTRI